MIRASLKKGRRSLKLSKRRRFFKGLRQLLHSFSRLKQKMSLKQLIFKLLLGSTQFIVFGYGGSLFAQNIVPNPSFESYVSCPTDNSQLSKCIGWKEPLNHTGTSDYFNACYPPSSSRDSRNVGVPNNFHGRRYAHIGNAYVGVSLRSLPGYNYREYVATELLEEMKINEKYIVELWYSSSSFASLYAHNMGIHFSQEMLEDRSPFPNYKTLDIEPSIKINRKLSDTLGWTKLEFCYTAKGGEKFITLGNFDTDANTIVSSASNNSYPYITPYVLLDDISVVKKKELVLESDTSLCKGDTLELFVKDKYDRIIWEDGSSSEKHVITETGLYWVSYANICGSFSDSINVRFKSPPIVSLGNDTMLCTMGSKRYVLPDSGLNYKWQDNSTENYYEILFTGEYSVLASNKCGEDSSKVYVKIINCSYSIDSFCQGDSTVFSVAENKLDSIRYVFGDGDSATEYGNITRHQYIMGGVYFSQMIFYSDTLKLVRTDTLKIIKVPTDFLFSDTTVCDPIYLVSSERDSAFRYLWSTNESKPTTLVDKSGLYILEINNEECFSIDSTLVSIEYCDCIVYIANAFSPNQDLLNNEFSVTTSCDISKFHMSVYSRWGEKIFDSKWSEANKWNGTYLGKPCQNGVYAYEMSYLDNYNNRRTLSGIVHLIR
jgi:gliding motility-associated-like protein